MNGAAESRRKLDAMAKVMGPSFDAAGWAPASKIILEVRAVPTCFVQVDRVTRVHGWPTDRFTLVHGPSNNGKSAFVLGLLRSFLERAHFGALIDAERTTPATWARQMIGSDLLESGAFRALYPTSYEGTVDAVRAWAEAIGDARAKGKIDKDTSGLLVLDSIRKLVPKRLLEKLLKEGSEGDDDARDHRGKKKQAAGVDGMSGRAAMYKAALNSAWMDELAILLPQCGVGMAVIAREYENSDPGLNFGAADFKLGGGKSLFFESSLVVRIMRESFVKEKTAKEELTVGERHRVEIHKTKVGEKDERIPRAYFHTSNGVSSPTGFDFARDVLELGVEFGTVEQRGSNLYFDGERLGQGEVQAVRRLHEDAHLFARVDGAVRAAMRPIPVNVVPSIVITQHEESQVLADLRAKCEADGKAWTEKYGETALAAWRAARASGIAAQFVGPEAGGAGTQEVPTLPSMGHARKVAPRGSAGASKKAKSSGKAKTKRKGSKR